MLLWLLLLLCTHPAKLPALFAACVHTLLMTRAALQETHIVMEFCDGGSLEEALGRGVFHPTASGGAQEPDLAAVCATLLDIAAAMEYLHQHARVILQDLKPKNVLLASCEVHPPILHCSLRTPAPQAVRTPSSGWCVMHVMLHIFALRCMRLARHKARAAKLQVIEHACAACAISRRMRVASWPRCQTSG